jgi:hypothetical protein
MFLFAGSLKPFLKADGDDQVILRAGQHDRMTCMTSIPSMESFEGPLAGNGSLGMQMWTVPQYGRHAPLELEPQQRRKHFTYQGY